MDGAKLLFYSFAAALLLTAFTVASLVFGTITGGIALLGTEASGSRILAVILAGGVAALIVGLYYTWGAASNRMPRPGLLSYLNLCLTAGLGTVFGLWLADHFPASVQGPLSTCFSAGAACLAPVFTLLHLELVDMPFSVEPNSNNSKQE